MMSVRYFSMSGKLENFSKRAKALGGYLGSEFGGDGAEFSDSGNFYFSRNCLRFTDFISNFIGNYCSFFIA
jgi:hypothetical protein